MNRWVLGARPRTLPAAVAPVLVGTGVAVSQGDIVWWRLAATMIVSVSIQVATNYANDYSDGVRGTDDNRVGPVRLVASGLAAPAQVKRAAWTAFTVAMVFGVWVSIATSLWLLLVGAASIAAGWFYTGGSKPYGYLGLGELVVFVFFGLVAVAGSAFVHVEKVTRLAVAAGVPVGLLATALLVVNNLRDIPTDMVSGKRTLAVRLGDPGTRALYTACLLLPYASLLGLALARGWVLIAFASLPLAVPPLRTVLRGATGPGLIPVLARTGQVQLVFAVLLAIGLSR